jgi:predicted HTH transcriptional regulator
MFFLICKIEKLCRVLSLIKKQFDEFGLKSPEWTFQNGYTKLTLYGVAQEITLNNRMIHFLKEINMNHLYSREDYVSFFKDEVSERTARMDLQKMSSGGWLKKTGDGPQTKYLRTDKKFPDFAG